MGWSSSFLKITETSFTDALDVRFRHIHIDFLSIPVMVSIFSCMVFRDFHPFWILVFPSYSRGVRRPRA